MKNIWLLILSMIPGFMVAEQSWPEWTFDATRTGIGQSLNAITYTVSTAKNVGSGAISIVKSADSADVTIAAIPVLYGRKFYKKCKSFNWYNLVEPVTTESLSNIKPTFAGMNKLKVLKFFKPVPMAVAIGFMHHALTNHTPTKWAEKQNKKS